MLTSVGARERSPAGSGLPPAITPSTYTAQNQVMTSVFEASQGLLLVRQPGQGGIADPPVRDLRAQLLQAEAAHFSKTSGKPAADGEQLDDSSVTSKRKIEGPRGEDGDVDEDPDAKRRRILEETRDIDAESDAESDSSEEDRFAI